jgi:formamidopyrimidine-DNA glycosylase
MPELPEVETTRLGLLAHVVGHRVRGVVVRDARLRWPVPRDLAKRLAGADKIRTIRRRGKYLLFDMSGGSLLVHLGMSGHLTLVPAATAPAPHDHVDVALDSAQALRLNDPRRFGAMLWLRDPVERHALLAGLGLEPFDPAFTGAWLHAKARGRRVPVKQFIMDSHVVTGIGNIYASEALFRARIHPLRAAGRIGPARCERLVEAIRATLSDALAAGGTTLRDYVACDGRPGAYQDASAVYGREGEPCPACGAPIRARRLGNRSTFYCAACQR